VGGGSDGVVNGEAERSFTACWWLVDEFVRRGMERACLSPGSRSTPIALALWRHPGIRVHVHLDERSSAFFALGISKATGRPVAVACTSGTAAAEFLPGLVEASMARVPLVAITADRPPELRGVGANQTIDQVGLYGRQVRFSEDAAVPSDVPDEPYWRGLGERATAAAMGAPRGPVHLNLPLREPLVPGTPIEPGPVSPAGPPVVPPIPAPTAEEAGALLEEVRSTERGMVFAGTMSSAPPAVAELARSLAWPLLAEPTSGLRTPGALTAGSLLLADEGFVASHVPEVLLQVGAAATSRAGLALAARAERLLIVDPDRVVADPHRRATRTWSSDADALAARVLAELRPRSETPWLRSWREADRAARRAVDDAMDGWAEPSELRVARDVASTLPSGSTLLVASSMPVRDLDAVMAPREGIRVIANRGASGIDGFVSTALGVAATGTTTVALTGDLSLLYDIGAVLWTARREPSAVFVVLNNGGGTIFSYLAQRDLPELEDLFTTPHGVDLAAVCRAAGAGHVVVARSDELGPAVERALSAGGIQVVEVPIDRERDIGRHAELEAAIALDLQG
jgi:2-succinyl-5-enolpyruvyl-6-hydroxy-3-cyclohexene-1-carboxylate synthase